MFFFYFVLPSLKIILVLNKKNPPKMRKSLEQNVIIGPSSLLPSSSVIEIRIQAGHTKVIQNIFVKYLAHLRLVCTIKSVGSQFVRMNSVQSKIIVTKANCNNCYNF